jgi:D-glycero-beta-D-manno-heptose 1-phosphate adenylyltransferase
VEVPDFLAKIVPRAQAARHAAALAQPLVFTNGVFDVLHRGHVVYLAQARQLGASLVVALNTDASARRLGKGPDRPLNNEHDRAAVIAALQSVSLVTFFDEDTPLQLIDELRPALLVKGGDYDMRTLPETALVEGYGGQARAIPFVEGYSTSDLVRRIRGSR